ncbi:Kinesin light chain 3 [Rhizophlyctis rosea]|nr:Kinesin light chain 3 [Rhizophlyctis rosea]
MLGSKWAKTATLVKAGKVRRSQTPVSEPGGAFPLLGVRLYFLKAFILDCGGVESFRKLTTAEVCDQFIKPRTAESVSICDQLAKRKSLAVRQANWFISHSWQCKFLEVIDAILAFFHGKNLSSDAVIWMDLFSLPQNHQRVIEPEWLNTTLTNSISTIENFLLVSIPWDHPIVLTRAWCLYELYACEASKTSFDIALPAPKIQSFIQSLSDENNTFTSMLTSIDSASSTATLPTDLHTLHETIRTSIGFDTLDRTIRLLLLKWLTKTLDILKDTETHSQTRLRLGQLCESLNETGLAENNYLKSGGTTSLTALAQFYTKLGRHVQAELLWEKCYKALTEDVEVGHADALKCMRELIASVEVQNKWEKVERLLVRLLEVEREALGRGYNGEVETMERLCGALTMNGKFTEAAALMSEVVDRKKRLLGVDDRRTLSSIRELIRLNHKRGEWDQTMSLCADCLERSRRVFREDDLDTLHSLCLLADTHKGAGEFEKAEKQYTECVDRSRRAHGVEHSETLWFVNKLATFYEMQGRYDQADLLLGRKLGGGSFGFVSQMG